MMKLVRNRASETITALEGAVLVPMAVRSRDSTTAILVKEVTMTRIEGAIDRTVTSATSCRACSVSPVPSGKFSVTDWAAAGATARTIEAAASASAAGSRRRITGPSSRLGAAGDATEQARHLLLEAGKGILRDGRRRLG